MEYRGLTGVLYQWCEWIMRLAYLHILWLLFTLLGGVILGVAPATAGMFAVLRQWFLGREDVPVFRTYWQSYRREFWGANLLGWLLFVVAAVLFVDLWVFRLVDGWVGLALSLFFLSLLFLLAITVLYAFPAFVHYRMGILQYVRCALGLGMSHLPLTLLMFVSIFLIGCLYVYLPGLIPAFGFSLVAFVIMKLSMIVFSKAEERFADQSTS
ncbi:YesL family protein [Desmospora activa]|uniref:Putative membrane protein YesL n=1 Tax=Desmospora activa DSM 45169 TaxID=1121389 RepID=A0A2T4ZDL0_9BACL|nr:YesL family protein [Desmospora activa]PTM59988.1 putative membrane protein YesL [Desmospora activa DSM 45169]